jgi:aminoglycoside 6'-N-acetyltransferase
MSHTYQFRAMTAADLPLVQRWLNTPHVAQWWGDPVHGLAQIAQHIGDRAVDVFIVILDDIPIGYLQS